MCVIILTCAAVCADTTPWMEANGCNPALDLPFLPVSLILSLPPLSLSPSHKPADLTSLHPPLFFLSCPTFSFSICSVLGSLPPQGLHAELIFIFPFHNSPSFKILLNYQLSSPFTSCTFPPSSSPFVPSSLPYSCCFGLVK